MLPAGDADYSTRWSAIKRLASNGAGPPWARQTNEMRGDSGLWQRRFWEHAIRDDDDLARHIDYIHWNPVKHGIVPRVADWPFSTFHRCVERGLYPVEWGDVSIEGDFGE
jgi:putative transposase